MAIDLSENGNGFEDLKKHIGHAVSIIGYGQAGDTDFCNITIECEDCNEVLIDIDRPE